MGHRINWIFLCSFYFYFLLKWRFVISYFLTNERWCPHNVPASQNSIDFSKQFARCKCAVLLYIRLQGYYGSYCCLLLALWSWKSRRDVIVTCTDFPKRSSCIFWSCILHLYICCTTMKRSTQLDSKYLGSIRQKPVQIDRRLTLSLQIYHFDRHNESIAMKIYIADSLLHFDSISAHFVLI